MKIELTENLLNYLSNRPKPFDEDKLFVRIGIPQGRFSLCIVPEYDVCDYDKVIYSEGDLLVFCDPSEYVLLRGTIVDYELYGLKESIVFKIKRFEGKTYIVGDVHPSQGGLIF